MLKLEQAVLVEGKYDAARLTNLDFDDRRLPSLPG